MTTRKYAVFSRHSRKGHTGTHSGRDNMHRTWAGSARLNPSTERGGVHRVPPLAEELWPTDNGWEGREDTNLGREK